MDTCFNDRLCKIMSKKYRRYKNRLELFLGSRKGKRILNFFYSWGAAIVIIGALFKLLHLPFGNQMLFVGMMTEFFVFFISAFEKPANEYHWENLFPQLDSDNPMDKEEMEARRIYLQEKAEQAAKQACPGMPIAPVSGFSSNVISPLSVSQDERGVSSDPDLSALFPQGDVDRLKAGIEKLTDSVEQLAKVSELSGSMQQTFNRMQSLVDTSVNYQQEMENLGRNIAGLNTIYELQLKGISSQIDTIDRINKGLQHIRDMYDGTIVDSSHFRIENERMASQLSQLNDVYARLLSALTVNMGASVVATPMQGRPSGGRSGTDVL